jgi:hypothetical protein
MVNKIISYYLIGLLYRWIARSASYTNILNRIYNGGEIKRKNGKKKAGWSISEIT